MILQAGFPDQNGMFKRESWKKKIQVNLPPIVIKFPRTYLQGREYMHFYTPTFLKPLHCTRCYWWWKLQTLLQLPKQQINLNIPYQPKIWYTAFYGSYKLKLCEWTFATITCNPVSGSIGGPIFSSLRNHQTIKMAVPKKNMAFWKGFGPFAWKFWKVQFFPESWTMEVKNGCNSNSIPFK